MKHLILAFLLTISALHAQVPNLINYQGRVAVGTVNFDGAGQFKFALVNTAGTSTYWSNDGTSAGGSQPTAAVPLTVTKGLYSVLLGDGTLANMTAIPASVWGNADVRLRVWFNDGTNGFQLLTPDQRLASNGYLPDGSVSATKMADGSVSSAKLANGAVGSAQLAAGAVAVPVAVSGITQTAAANSSYVATGPAATHFILPSNANIGDTVEISGVGAGGWSVDHGSREWAAWESNRSWWSVASSADGTKLVAVVYGGQIYTSTDSGVSWSARESNRPWRSVTSSADGTKLVAVIYPGQIYTSTDSGVSWTARESNRYWQSVASSADGTKLVAGTDGGPLYTSTDSGVSWTARESNRNWYSVASSADGTKIVAVDYYGTGAGGKIYTSTDSGVSWTARESNRQWRSVASSADGTKLVAVFGANGQIYTSTNSGVSWTVQENNRSWQSVASSADGTKLVAAVYGGQIYSLGPIAGAQGSGVALQYLGSGQWAAIAQSQIAPGAVGSAQLANGAVGSTQIANGAVGSAQLAAGAVGSAQLANEAVGSAQLAAGAVSAPLAVSGSSQTAAANTSYAATGSTTTNFDLPANATVGDTIEITGVGTGGWTTTLYNPSLWTPRESNRNWRAIGSSSDGLRLVAAANNGQLYTSSDSGITWIPREAARAWAAVASSSDGSKLVAVVTSGQIYASADYGVTWTARESSRAWSSVASSADGTKLLATTGGGQLYTSIDSGVSWTARESNRAWNASASSADGIKLVACAYNDQIYTSIDSGVTWTARPNAGTFRAWTSVASSADGTNLIAVADGSQIYTSSDSGVTWTARDSSRRWYGVASSADGTKLVALDLYGPPENGFTGGRIYTSTDSGLTWTPRESYRLWRAVTSSADGNRLTAVVSIGGQIYTSGHVDGSQGNAVKFQYVGGGQWVPVAETQIAAGAVGTAQLAAKSVTSSQIADGAVATAQLADNSVTSAKIVDGTVGSSDLASGLTLSGTTTISGSISIPANGLTVGSTQLVTASGNVGIGTASPNSKLTVGTPINGQGFLKGITMGSNTEDALIATGQDSTHSLVMKWAYNANPANAYGVVETYGGSNPLVLQGAGGSVGIGTTNPTYAKLVVSGGPSQTGLTATYLQPNGGSFTPTGHGAHPFSIYATGGIRSDDGFYASSDARIKIIDSISDGAADLHALLGIEVTNYRYRDKVARGEATQKKAIAQQVEKVFPGAVSKVTNVIPDIYQKAPCKDGWIELKTDLKKGERVRLTDDKSTDVFEVLEVGENKFRTAFRTEGVDVFVYGREVKDFRVVDYEAISMLNVSATQELARQLAAQQAENARLAAENVAMKQQLAAQAARDRAIEARLAALEQAAPAATTKTVKVALKQ